MAIQQIFNWLNTFTNRLADLVKEAPYLVIFFVSTIFVIISLFRSTQFYTFLAVFLYSAFGLVWRHAVKDIRGWVGKDYPDKSSKINFWLTVAYQFVNLVAVAGLIFVIVRYCV